MGERVALIADEETFEIAELFADRAEAAAATVVLCRMKAAGMHGAEPAPDIARYAGCGPDRGFDQNVPCPHPCTYGGHRQGARI